MRARLATATEIGEVRELQMTLRFTQDGVDHCRACDRRVQTYERPIRPEMARALRDLYAREGTGPWKVSMARVVLTGGQVWIRGHGVEMLRYWGIDPSRPCSRRPARSTTAAAAARTARR